MNDGRTRAAAGLREAGDGWRRYDVTPVAKPRMTRRDQWLRRPIVESYWAYKRTLQLLAVELPDRAHVVFVLPMPESWSRAKRLAFDGVPHRVRPDLDNLHKGLLDALYGDDCIVAEARIAKVWGERGAVLVREIATARGEGG